MFLVRWVRLIVVGGVAAVALAAGTSGPALLLALWSPGYRVAGMLVALPVVVLLAWSPALVRTVVGTFVSLEDGAAAPATPGEVAEMAEAARAAGQKVPTVLVAVAALPRPMPFRGLRRDLLIVSPTQVAQPRDTVAALARARQRGDDRLVLLLGALAIALGGWSSVMRAATAPVRPGRLSALQRISMMAWLLAVPVVAFGWGICWTALQVTRAVLPRHLTEGLLALTGSTRFVQQPPVEDVVGLGDGVTLSEAVVVGLPGRQGGRPRPAARTWWNTPQALAADASVDILSGVSRIIIGVLFIGVGTYAGLGRIPAERIAWPWQDVQQATVVDVTATRDPGGRSLIEVLGADVGTTYAADARLPDGSVIALTPGSGPVAVGDEVRVVVDPERPGEARSLTQNSTADLVSLSVVMIAAGAGFLRLVSGGILGLFTQRKLAQADYDQRVMTGRRHRRRRPRALLGATGLAAPGPGPGERPSE